MTADALAPGGGRGAQLLFIKARQAPVVEQWLAGDPQVFHAIATGGVTYGDEKIPDWDWVETLLPTGARPSVDVVDAILLDPIRVVAGRPAMAMTHWSPRSTG